MRMGDWKPWVWGIGDTRRANFEELARRHRDKSEPTWLASSGGCLPFASLHCKRVRVFIMVLIKPEDNLKLGIPEIDAQHETMTSLVNLIHETMLQGADKATLDGLLSRLLEHTQTHFAYEEELMSRYNYPGYDEHKSEHNRLMQHLTDLAERYSNGELLLSFAVALELKGWALVHIEKLDKPLGTFLNNRKITEATAS